MLTAAVPDQERLLSMSRQQLDDLYRSSPAGPVPNGRARGVAIVAPGRRFSKTIAEAIELFGWQGKTFDAAQGVLLNRITPFGINAIAAKVYAAPSLLDDKECIVLDYSRTSTLAFWIRDEIRNVAPDLYLGFAYWNRLRLIGFSLDFSAHR
jgi:hypothetical protein